MDGMSAPDILVMSHDLRDIYQVFPEMYGPSVCVATYTQAALTFSAGVNATTLSGNAWTICHLRVPICTPAVVSFPDRDLAHPDVRKYNDRLYYYL